MRKKVKYVNKKGEVKYYYYDKNYSKTKKNILITKGGKIYENRINNFIDKQDFVTKNKMRAIVEYYKANTNRTENLNERRLKSIVARDRREKMIINAGQELNDILRQLETTEEEYFNEDNWKNNVFTNSNKKSFKFIFNYNNDALFRRI